jgi:hypothetical protein
MKNITAKVVKEGVDRVVCSSSIKFIRDEEDIDFKLEDSIDELDNF